MKVFTVSNFFSFIRIFFIIPSVYYIQRGDGLSLLYVLMGASATDFLDGYFARKLNQVSELGKILDPIADKVLMAGVVFALYYYQGFPLWFIFAIVTRDSLILLGSSLLMSKDRYVYPSIFVGKVTVTILSVTIIAFFLDFPVVFKYLVYVSVVAIVLSFFAYLRVFIEHYFEKE
jgi:CDP-diacylglycerol--glycerol-3-phosphate 3-phosphatidyltransferase